MRNDIACTHKQHTLATIKRRNSSRAFGIHTSRPHTLRPSRLTSHRANSFARSDDRLHDRAHATEPTHGRDPVEKLFPPRRGHAGAARTLNTRPRTFCGRTERQECSSPQERSARYFRDSTIPSRYYYYYILKAGEIPGQADTSVTLVTSYTRQ